MCKLKLAALLITFSIGSFSHAQQRKNVVFFLIDDLGWADIGVNGSSFYETPNIDALAKQGMRFTNAYAASPVCSPTRASILTGKSPATLQNTDWFGAVQPQEAREHNYWSKKPMLPAPYREFLAPEEKTIAEAFSDNGYKTMIAGKWHLGEGEKSSPENHGFSVNKGGTHKGHPDSYFSPYNNTALPDGPTGEYLSDRLADEAISFIEENKSNPFFLYFPMYDVHTPLQANAESIKKYEAKKTKLGIKDEIENSGELVLRNNQSLPVYAAMVEAMDAVIGKILKKITAVGLEENTIIVFFSDNGGLSTKEGSPTSNKPFRAGKGWLYEGGIRVPLIIKSKKQIKAGTVSNTPVIAQDLYPTLLRMNNLAAMPTQHTEGIDFSPILMGKKITRKALYWHYPHYGNQGGFPGSAIRMGNWKLIQNFETNAYELYNLETDLGEKNNMANNQQERVTEMSTLLAAWQKATGAKLPSINNQAELAATKNYFIPVLQELKQKWPNNRTINLVFHGHSVPSGYFATPNINSVNAYPFLVFKAVSNQYNTATINSINTAIGGENSEQGAARFETTVLNHQPDVLFIDYALNDRGIGLVRAKAAWSAMIQKALAKQIKVVLLTPTPDLKENMFDDNTPLQQYANQIIALGKQYNVAVVDAYSSFKQLLMEGKDLQEYMAQNNHPNAQGHQVVASAILKLFNVQVNTAN